MIDGFAKDHLPQSEKLYKFIADLDFKAGDIFCFKDGGDGDNGELLMDYFDKWFLQSEEEEQPQQKTGHWIDDCTCSVCTWTNDGDDGFARTATHFNYCPHCGAKMDENYDPWED